LPFIKGVCDQINAVNPLSHDYERTFYKPKIFDSDLNYYWTDVSNFMSVYRNETQEQIDNNKNKQKQKLQVIYLFLYYIILNKKK